MERIDVIALGGNALLPAGKSGTIEQQFEITRLTMSHVAAIVASGRRVVLTHGNGPIVGNIVLRNEAVRESIPPMPLDVCVADSQGGIGYMLQQVLGNALRAAGAAREVVSLVTQVRVDGADPAFDHPTKPIGPYYTREQAESLRSQHGWAIEDDSGRGFRRMVASPVPQEIVELEGARRLLLAGFVVIAAGGGGVPVVDDQGAYRGVEAVVDKDLASAVLARDLGAERLIIVTQVDAVYTDFGTARACAVPRLDAAGARALAATLSRGSMAPKLDAAASFVGETGGEAIITSPENILEAIAGRSGTLVSGQNSAQAQK